MTIKQLIDELSKFDPNLIVKRENRSWVQISEYTSDIDVTEEDIEQISERVERNHKGKEIKNKPKYVSIG